MRAVGERPVLDPDPLSAWVAWSGQNNRDEILDALRDQLPKGRGQVLELGSGSGMHIHYFAPHFPGLTFHPSDRDESTFERIRALTAETELINIRPPIAIDLTRSDQWPSSATRYDAIFCINVLHVAPKAAIDGLAASADRLLADGGSLLIYGPFKVEGRYAAACGEEIDLAFRSLGNPEWGFRDVADLTAALERRSFGHDATIEMPSGRLMVKYVRKQAMALLPRSADGSLSDVSTENASG